MSAAGESKAAALSDSDKCARNGLASQLVTTTHKAHDLARDPSLPLPLLLLLFSLDSSVYFFPSRLRLFPPLRAPPPPAVRPPAPSPTAFVVAPAWLKGPPRHSGISPDTAALLPAQTVCLYSRLIHNRHPPLTAPFASLPGAPCPARHPSFETSHLSSFPNLPPQQPMCATPSHLRSIRISVSRWSSWHTRKRSTTSQAGHPAPPSWQPKHPHPTRDGELRVLRSRRHRHRLLPRSR